MFLSDEEVARLTGRSRKSAQRRWLLDHGYPHDVNALGEPIVLVATVEARLGGKGTSKSKLNWAAIAAPKCDDTSGGM